MTISSPRLPLLLTLPSATLAPRDGDVALRAEGALNVGAREMVGKGGGRKELLWGGGGIGTTPRAFWQ